MSGRVFLVRHAESKHNVDKNFDQLDPELTKSGCQEAVRLGQRFPDSETIGVILSSPLRRTLQTTLLAFPNALDKRYFDGPHSQGIEGGATLIVDPAAQERSDLPCDTGSDRPTLEEISPLLDFSDLPNDWQLKTGINSAGDDAVRARASRLRQRLGRLLDSLLHTQRKDVVVVTHGVFMKVLTENEDIDLPRPGWAAYYVNKDVMGNSILVPAE
jgi:broad specificity phosphatase PhoE